MMAAKWDTPMTELADQGEPLADDANCYLEVDVANRFAVVCWVEELAFHAELARANPHGVQGKSWDDLTDSSSGELTPAARDALIAELERLLKEQGIDAEIDDAEYLQGDDRNPAFGLEIATRFHEGETFGSWFDRVGWPIVATLINVTDPGTYNSPYLFSALFR